MQIDESFEKVHNNDYIQSIDLSLLRDDELFLSMFLRYSGEVLIFSISRIDNKFQELAYRTKIDPYFINDISYSENNIFVCLDNATIARIYPNTGDS